MADPPLSETSFQEMTNVSRETMERFRIYVRELRRWNRAINLVGALSLKDVWRRHILDCAQLAPLIPSGAKTIVDMGSGAGLPGLILAILALETYPLRVVLVESHSRKCAFLTTLTTKLALPVDVVNGRLEEVPRFDADVITSRALAPLDRLLGHASRFAGPKTECIFLKGQNVELELTAATEYWTMSVDLQPSLSDPLGRVVHIQEFCRAR
jgi:16S rRNA (guanine527-N7)-methyltransferase